MGTVARHPFGSIEEKEPEGRIGVHGEDICGRINDESGRTNQRAASHPPWPKKGCKNEGILDWVKLVKKTASSD